MNRKLLTHPRGRLRHAQLPPGPRMPSALQAVGWAERPLAFMERAHARYGDTFTLRIRHAGTWVFLCDPDDVRRVFTTESALLGVGEANNLLGPILGSRSVMLLEEPEHMAHRRRMLPSFHGRLMEQYGSVTATVAREEARRWPVGEPFALWPRMQDITLTVIMRAVFGELDSEPLLELRELLRALTEWMNVPRRLTLLAAIGPRALVRNPEFRSLMDAAEQAVLDEVRRRRALRMAGADASAAAGNGVGGRAAGNRRDGGSLAGDLSRARAGATAGATAGGRDRGDRDGGDRDGGGCAGDPSRARAGAGGQRDGERAWDPPRARDSERGDIVAMLERAHQEDGTPLSDQELRDELITLLVDGPTSSSLAWAFERLLRHPEKLARLRAEVDAGEQEAYMDAVLRETLRLCPPVPIVVRRLLEPLRLGGYSVPVGSTVAPCIYLVHRRPEIYPEPRRFLPERFVGQAPGTYTWLPFGGGTRRCLAASFALLEMKQAIGAVLSEVELAPAHPRSERVARSSIAFVPEHRALAIVVRRRESPAPSGRPPVRTLQPTGAAA
jgi:cytochrome P450